MNVKFQSNEVFQLILLQLQTPQGTFELKSFKKKNIQNSDLVKILLAFDKERKEYFITMLSSFTYILSGEVSGEEAEAAG